MSRAILWKKSEDILNIGYENKNLQRILYCGIIQNHQINAKKETLVFRERQEYGVTDWERRLQEKIKGTLRSRQPEREKKSLFSRAVRFASVMCQSGERTWWILSQCGWYRGTKDCFAPGIQRRIPRAFYCFKHIPNSVPHLIIMNRERTEKWKCWQA